MGLALPLTDQKSHDNEEDKRHHGAVTQEITESGKCQQQDYTMNVTSMAGGKIPLVVLHIKWY